MTDMDMAAPPVRTARRDLSWHRLPAPAQNLWTDDFASILPHIQWQNILGN
ncbi:hypothetical protein [Erythrobacter sp. QSSC1-22B]|uniref:hypothetical protein n=1 Tax=Erythrobacter sp. QSSC1-22B TaxID=1860125 RepID=UPI00143AD20B|nr:hypothetical protein [Erythrobacter sp. QSSC1-22B]